MQAKPPRAEAAAASSDIRAASERLLRIVSMTAMIWTEW